MVDATGPRELSAQDEATLARADALLREAVELARSVVRDGHDGDLLSGKCRSCPCEFYVPIDPDTVGITGPIPHPFICMRIGCTHPLLHHVL
jgi:hypothetical protein